MLLIPTLTPRGMLAPTLLPASPIDSHAIHMYVYVCVYIYIYIYTHINIYTHICVVICLRL